MANRPRNYSELNKTHEAAKEQLSAASKTASHEKKKRKDKQGRKRLFQFRHDHPPAEAAAIRAKIKESGLTPARFFAAAALGLSIPRQVSRKSFRAAMWELGKIGTNINQMAKVANQRGIMPACAVLERVGADIQAAIQQLAIK